MGEAVGGVKIPGILGSCVSGTGPRIHAFGEQNDLTWKCLSPALWEPEKLLTSRSLMTCGLAGPPRALSSSSAASCTWLAPGTNSLEFLAGPVGVTERMPLIGGHLAELQRCLAPRKGARSGCWDDNYTISEGHFAVILQGGRCLCLATLLFFFSTI